MKKIITLITAALMTSATALAQWSSTDTVKVIKNPEQVTITRQGNEVRLNVEGYGLGKRYEYQYNVKPDNNGSLETTHREGRKWQFDHPFKAEDTISTKPHFSFFLSDFYFGWGRCNVTDDNVQKKSMSEIGILNLIGAKYVFNANRTAISLGVGFGWSRYGLKPPYFYSRSDAGVLGNYEIADNHSRHKAMLQVWALQVPLMFHQKLGKKWEFSIGGIMNWNYYADAQNRYNIDKTLTETTIKGLYQRKITFDVRASITYRSLGVYFRYAPQSIIKAGYGPYYKNRWTLGITLLH